MSGIVAHTLVKNESRWIWFALMSVIGKVDEIMVWDTGSIDGTVEIVKTINSPKISLKSYPVSTPQEHTSARQAMLDQTRADWIMILDGDEIWWQESLDLCLQLINEQPAAGALVSPFINLVGDMYHFQDRKRSRYVIGPYRGAYNLRFINRKIPGLHVANPHGRQEYRDRNEVALQNLPPHRLIPADKPYLHTTHLPRSVSARVDKNTLKRDFKYRWEPGHRFSRNFVYPEVLYLPRPDIVPDPWFARGLGYEIKSRVYEGGRMVKNAVFRKQESGY